MKFDKEKIKKFAKKAGEKITIGAIVIAAQLALAVVLSKLDGDNYDGDYNNYLDDDDYSSSSTPDYEYEDVYEEYDYDNDEYDLDWED